MAQTKKTKGNQKAPAGVERRSAATPHPRKGRDTVSPFQDPLRWFWQKWEYEKGQVLLASGVVTLLLFALVCILFYVILQKDQRISELASEQIMIGVPTGQGTFRSVEQKPLKVVKNYGETFVNNVYNYTSNTIDTNFASALSMVDPRRRTGIKSTLDGIRKEVKKDGLSQLFARKKRSIESVEGGYVYTTRGTVIEYGGQYEVARREVKVTVEIIDVPQTKAKPLGVRVISIEEQTIEGS